MKIKEYPYQVKYENLNNDLSLAYMEEGEGIQTLLFLHGMGSYSPAFLKNISILKNHFHCIAIDLPNYGLSSKGDYSFTMHFFAETVKEFISRKKLDKIVLVGHSMGAQIALTAILKFPELAEKLVLLAPAGFETFSNKEIAYFNKLITQDNLMSLSESEIQSNFELNFYGNKIPKDAQFMFEDRLAIKQNKLEYSSLCNMISKCVQEMLKGPVCKLFPLIDIPVLTIFGQNDMLIPNPVLHPHLNVELVAQQGSNQFPNVELHLLQECGHFVQWDRHEKVNELITKFAL